jgi:hypothetical protein
MARRQHICILGNSLILNGLGESLQRSGRFDLTCMESPEDAQGFDSMMPDAILFDLESPYKESVFSLSESCPRLLLIGISPGSNIVKVWIGQQLRELSMQNLLAMINDQLKFTLAGGWCV